MAQNTGQNQQNQQSQHGQQGQQGSSSSSLARRQPYGGAMARRGAGWDDFNVMRRQMDDLFTRFFGYTPMSQMSQMSPMFSADMMQNEPDVDIYETDDNVEVYASLPGYTPDQINVECTADSILISGERQPMPPDQSARQHRQSNVTGYSRFSVAYALPNEIDPSKVTANFQNGVLHLEMPIAEQAKPKTVKVNVAGGQQGQQGRQPQLQSQEGQGGSQNAGTEQRQQRKAA